MNSVPELAALPKARRKELWREFVRRSPGIWYYVLGLPTYIGAALLAQMSFPILYRSYPFAFLGIVYGAIGLALGYFGQHLRIAGSLPELRKRLGGLCPNCGYDVRATPDRCPECGLEPKPG